MPPRFPTDNSEAIFDKLTMSALEGTPLSIALRDCGITSMALVGVAMEIGIEPTARHAADLGYQVFVVAEACQAADTIDLRGRVWPAEDVRALALARLKGETATIVDVATTLRAAATAKARQRRASGRA